MITGSYTNSDGGVHPQAVARVATMTIDVTAEINTVKIEVYHDFAAAKPVKPPQRPRPLATKVIVLKGASYMLDPTAIEGYLMTQAFLGWTELNA